MRALIEAAEAMADTYLIAPDDVVESLRAAISSAKAAEEGVETAWLVEYLSLGGNWVKDSYVPDSLNEVHQIFENAAINTRNVRLVQYDTYTTVISVRENRQRKSGDIDGN
jgi:hypothetical protein